MTASIFTPKDDTLDARIDAWRQVREANRQLKESMNLNSSEWQDRLGEQADLQFAQETIASSYTQASQSISKKELEYALKCELLSKNEASELVMAQRTAQSLERSKQLGQSNALSRQR